MRLAKTKDIINKESIYTMRVTCDYEKKGMYYFCKLNITPEKSFLASYEDGVDETVEVAQIRLQLSGWRT
jgi:hypothetical protein